MTVINIKINSIWIYKVIFKLNMIILLIMDTLVLIFIDKLSSKTKVLFSNLWIKCLSFCLLKYSIKKVKSILIRNKINKIISIPNVFFKLSMNIKYSNYLYRKISLKLILLLFGFRKHVSSKLL